MKKKILCVLIIFISVIAYAQQIKKALFIGNSYTGVNDLPGLVDSIARSKGDSLIQDSNTPGGYTFQLHTTNAATISKISSNSWDYVILQEQSQLPSFPPSQVQTDVIPYADTLNQMIKANDSCTTTLFYMTWGRKNGDASNCLSYPPVCTYNGMQGRLRYSYVLLAQMFGEVCPAGMAWKRVRDLDSTINLYQADESHPTIFGSYLVACTFYACIFHKSPVGATYIPAGISQSVASFLQAVADSTVFDSLAVWNIDTSTVHAGFTYTTTGNGVYLFQNNSSNSTGYLWTFGDGDSSNTINPSHNFSGTGTYDVTLIATRNCFTDTVVKHINVVLGSFLCPHPGVDLFIYPIPAKDVLSIYYRMEGKDDFVEIIDIQGIMVQKNTIFNRLPYPTYIPDDYHRTTTVNLDISKLPTGVYCLKVFNGTRYYKPARFIKL